jgi:hypothetical protein
MACPFFRLMPPNVGWQQRLIFFAHKDMNDDADNDQQERTTLNPIIVCPTYEIAEHKNNGGEHNDYQT